MNINDFMRQFHAFERDQAMFDSAVNDELWWHTVRFEVCRFLYDCLSGLNYSMELRPAGPSRAIGRARRALEREVLLVDSRRRRRDWMIFRAARSVDAHERRHDVVLDPMVALLPTQPLVINTMPRRFHVPDVGHLPPARLAPRMVEQLDLLSGTFSIDGRYRGALMDLCGRVRAEYVSQLAGYHRLFSAARPRGVLMVQNGVGRALFTAASERGIPVAEAQHGLIGFGHPGYSYPRGIDYSRQPGFPRYFLTFSPFWMRHTHYPIDHGVIGTDHFAAGMRAPPPGDGTVMVVSAGIYHDELMDLTRNLAQRLPARRFIYKLHPGQLPSESSIRAALADLPNVEVGAASVPAAAIMDEVTHLVAIQSTVVYEALQSGRRIVIVPQHDYHLHADLFGQENVAVPETEAAMADAISVPVDGNPGPSFFEKFDTVRARALFETLLLKLS